MADNNLTAVFYKQRDIRLQDFEIPEPGSGQVQIRIENVGICGSDITLWEHNGIPGMSEVKAPFAIGHECSGVISKLGEGVTSLTVGDKVVLDPLFPCGHCFDCKTGRYNLCPTSVICGLPHYGGYMTRYFVQSAEHCFRLPDNVSLEEGVMLEPLAVVLYACRRGGISPGHKVLVCGAGPIGLLTLMAAKAFGASSVCVTEIMENRIEMAKKLGADYTLNVTSMEPNEVAETVEKLFSEKPNVAVECSGAASATQTAVFATRSGGRFVQVGLGAATVAIPMVNATIREVDIIGILSNTHCTPLAIEMVASGRIDVKPVITHRFKLENVVKAFELAESRAGGKVIIKCGKN